MAKLSKKQAKQIAVLINACTCYTRMVHDEVRSPTRNEEKVSLYMDWHDENGKELNALLGTEAIFLYTPEAV